MYRLVPVKVFVVHKRSQALFVEVPLYLRKACFNRIEVRRVSDVANPHDIALPVGSLDVLGSVNAQVVHDYRERVATVLLSQCVQILTELDFRDCSPIYS